MYNRVLFTTLIVGAWLIFKWVDYYVPGPVILMILCLVVAIMSAHSFWLYLAQQRWQRRLKKNAAKKAPVAHAEVGVGSPSEAYDEIWQPEVDIFISAKNEGRVIEGTVRRFMTIDYAKYSFWVIDDMSDDDMPQVLERLQKEFPKLKVLTRKPGSYPGKSAALNEALPLSKAEVIAVFDADASVDPNFLKITLPVLAPENVGAVQVQKKIYEANRNFLIECQASEYAVDTYFQMGRDLIGGAVELRGNGELIKREALIDVGGWNTRSITDDLDLSTRLLISNWDIRFCPQAEVWEEGVPTLKSLLRQRKRWAEGSIRRYLDYLFALHSPTRLSFAERFDILAFVTEFTVPALLLLELFSEAVNFVRGVPIHPRLLLMIWMVIAGVSQLNFIAAFRHYRKDLTLRQALFHSCELSLYAFSLWLPCIFWAMSQIMFKKQSSTWHRTEHFGQQAQ